MEGGDAVISKLKYERQKLNVSGNISAVGFDFNSSLRKRKLYQTLRTIAVLIFEII